MKTLGLLGVLVFSSFSFAQAGEVQFLAKSGAQFLYDNMAGPQVTENAGQRTLLLDAQTGTTITCNKTNQTCSIKNSLGPVSPGPSTYSSQTLIFEVKGNQARVLTANIVGLAANKTISFDNENGGDCYEATANDFVIYTDGSSSAIVESTAGVDALSCEGG